MEANHNMANQGDVNKTQTSNKATAPSVLSQRKTGRRKALVLISGGSVDDWLIAYDNRRFSDSKARREYNKSLRTYQYDPSQLLIIPWPIKFETKTTIKTTFDPRSQNTLSANIVSSASMSANPAKSISFPLKLDNILDPSGDNAGIVVRSQNGLLCDNIIEFYKPKVPKFFKHLRLVSKFQPADVRDGIEGDVLGVVDRSASVVDNRKEFIGLNAGGNVGGNANSQNFDNGNSFDGDEDDEPIFVQRDEHVDLKNEYQIIVEQESKPTDETFRKRQEEVGKLDWEKDLNDNAINTSPENRERFAKFVHYQGWKTWKNMVDYGDIMKSPHHNQLKIALCRRGEVKKLMYSRLTYATLFTHLGDASESVECGHATRSPKGMEWHHDEVEDYAQEILLWKRVDADYGSNEVKRLLKENGLPWAGRRDAWIEMMKGREYMIDAEMWSRLCGDLETKVCSALSDWDRKVDPSIRDWKRFDIDSVELKAHKLTVKRYKTLGTSVNKRGLFNGNCNASVFRNLYFKSRRGRSLRSRYYREEVPGECGEEYTIIKWSDIGRPRSEPSIEQRRKYIPKLKEILSDWRDLYEVRPTPFEEYGCYRTSNAIPFKLYVDLFHKPRIVLGRSNGFTLRGWLQNPRADENIILHYKSHGRAQIPFERNSIFYQNMEKVRRYSTGRSHPKCKFAAKMSQQFFWDVDFVC